MVSGDKKLVVRKSHGIEMAYGSKMTPSYPMKKPCKKHKGHFVDQDYEFGLISISPAGFHKNVRTTYDPYELSHEEHELLADVFNELAHSHYSRSKRG